MKTVNFKFLAMLATTLMAAFVFAACDKDDNKKDEKKPDQQENTNGNKDDNSEVNIPETNGEVKEIDDEYFKQYVWDYKSFPEKLVYKGDKPVVVDFNATWCGPCKMLKPVLEKLAKKHAGKSYIYGVDVDEAGKPLSKTSNAYIACAKMFHNPKGYIPFVILISPRGEKVKSIVGYDGKNTESVIDNFITNNSK